MEIKLKGISLPKMISDLTYKYHVLVILSLSSLLIAALSVILAIILSSKKPTVIALNTQAEVLELSNNPNPEAEITQAIKKYLEYRYNWNSQNVKENIKKVEKFIGSKSMSAFQSNMNQVIQFSVERDVSQNVYANEVKIDLKNQTAYIKGDRVTAIQGLKAAGNLNLALEFESGARTKTNPWGIYITKETEGK